MDITIPEKVVQWKFSGKPGNLRSQNSYSTAGGGNGYSMFCSANNRYLTYEHMNFGINIDYKTDPGEHKGHFVLPDGKEREILSGEKVAFGIGGGDAFLRYAHRTVGINLEWSGKPVFEWMILGDTVEKGKPIPTNSWCSIVNVNVERDGGQRGDFLVYLDRPDGGDIGWVTSPDWKAKFADWATGKVEALIVATIL